MSHLRLYLFGSPRIEFLGETVKIERRKALALAAYLALSEQPQSREVIAGLLWSDLDNEHGRSALRSTIRALITPFSLDWLQADRASLALRRERVWIDVSSFMTLLSGTDSHGHSVDIVCDECARLYKEAIGLYRSDFMAGFHLTDNVDFENWQLEQREWLRREFAQAQRQLTQYYGEAKQYELAIKQAQQWLSIDALHEPAHRQLMRFYMANGQRTEALRQYKRCVEILDAELATPPETETIQLYQAILNDQFTPNQRKAIDCTPLVSIMPPLPSLVFGREEALSEIKRRMGIGSGAEMRPITVIQGWPGVGKSTTVAMLAHDPEIATHFPDGILWASLGENPDLSGEINAWAETLKIGETGRTRKIEDTSAQITAQLRDKHVLLILDDVWNPEHVTPFRVGGQFCTLIMTTRLNDVASALTPTADDLYRLPVLSEAAALELMSKLTPQTVSEYGQEARALVRDLEGLPLAIHVAGRLLQSEARLGWGIRELLVELRTGAKILQAQAPSDMLSVSRDTSPTIAALLARSTNALDVETRRQFAYLGLFVPKPATFDLEAMVVAWEVPDPRPIARLLVNRGLLEPVSGGRFQMHALLVLHARALLESEGY